jgi:hypothetical protein
VNGFFTRRECVKIVGLGLETLTCIYDLRFTVEAEAWQRLMTDTVALLSVAEALVPKPTRRRAHQPLFSPTELAALVSGHKRTTPQNTNQFDWVSAALMVTRRTLYRYLKECGLTFRDL